MASIAVHSNVYSRVVLAVLSIGIVGAVSGRAQECKLADAYVKREAMHYVLRKAHRENPKSAERDFQARITDRSDHAWTVVVSSLPVIPDANVVLRVRCDKPVVEEIP